MGTLDSIKYLSGSNYKDAGMVENFLSFLNINLFRLVFMDHCNSQGNIVVRTVMDKVSLKVLNSE